MDSGARRLAAQTIAFPPRLARLAAAACFAVGVLVVPAALVEEEPGALLFGAVLLGAWWRLAAHANRVEATRSGGPAAPSERP